MRDEAAQGRDRHRLVPLSIDGSHPPLGFGQYQVIDLSRWRGDPAASEIAAILRAVAMAAGQPALPLRAISAGAPQMARLAAAVDRRGRRGQPCRGRRRPDCVAYRPGPRRTPPVQAIAVLPFKNLSGDPGAGLFRRRADRGSARRARRQRRAPGRRRDEFRHGARSRSQRDRNRARSRRRLSCSTGRSSDPTTSSASRRA